MRETPTASEERSVAAEQHVTSLTAYAAERSAHLVDELRSIRVVRDVLASDRSGAVARLLHGLLCLAVTESFRLAPTLAHQEPGWGDQDWVAVFLQADRLAPHRQIAGSGAVPMTPARLGWPRQTVQQAIGRLRQLEADVASTGSASA